MKIFKIEGSICYLIACKGYYASRELAENALHCNGYYLETRKWKHRAGHEQGTDNHIWYNKRLSEDGYEYDGTSYATIREIEVITE